MTIQDVELTGRYLRRLASTVSLPKGAFKGPTSNVHTGSHGEKALLVLIVECRGFDLIRPWRISNTQGVGAQRSGVMGCHVHHNHV